MAAGQLRARPGHRRADGDRRPRAGRRRRRHDLHQRAAGHRRCGSPGRTVPLITQLTGIFGQVGSIAAAYPLVALLHGDLVAGRRSSARPAIGVLVVVLVPGGAAGRAGRAPPRRRPADLAEVRRRLRRHLARARHPHRALHAPGHPVLRHRVRPAVGLPVPGRGGGALPGDGGRPAHPARRRRHGASGRCWAGCAGGGRCAGRRWSSRSWPRPPRAWTVVLLWPGRAPLPAAGRAGRRPGHQRPRLDDRLRLRAHVEPGGADGQRQRRGQRGRVRRLAADHPRDRRPSSTCSRPGSSTDYDLGAFRAAFAVQYVFWAVGLVGVVRHRRQLRGRLARDGVVLVPLYVRGAAPGCAAARPTAERSALEGQRTCISATTIACAV